MSDHSAHTTLTPPPPPSPPSHPLSRYQFINTEESVPAASVRAQTFFTITVRLCQHALEAQRLTDQVFQMLKYYTVYSLLTCLTVTAC